MHPNSRIEIYSVFLVVLLVHAATACRRTGTGDTETSAYSRMPRVFHYEDKLQCLHEDPSNVYCISRTLIKPDRSSENWNLIEENSAQCTDLQRYVLDRGFCIKNCKTLMNSMTQQELKQYDHEPVEVDIPHTYDSSYIPNMGRYRQKYNQLTNICHNYHLRHSYNLSGYSFIEHCMSADDLRKPMTLFHILFVALSSIIIFLVIRATYYDTMGVRSQNNNQAAAKDHIWMEFSLKRSIRRLFDTPQTTLHRDFAFVESVRVISVLLITAVHVLLAFGASPMENPEYMELLFRNPLMRMVSAVFPFLVHTFFTIGGMLLSVQFLVFLESGPKFRWQYFFKRVAYRYLRLFPVYFIMWLYQVSWIDRLGDGATVHSLVGVEMQMCKDNGWLNFLFINNYYKFDKVCMLQTWYLSADFQFYCIGILLMMILWRFPRSFKLMIYAMMSISIIAPIVNNYVNNFVGVVLSDFKQLRFMLFFFRWARHDYILPHPHTCSYFSGIIAGIAYHRFRKDPQYLERLRAYLVLKRLAPLMVLLLSAPATFFYNIKPAEVPLWMAFYASAHRNFFGIMCGVGLLYGATDGSVRLPAIMRHPTMLAVGRLSFSVYLAQFNAIRYVFMDVKVYGFYLNVINYLYSFTLSYVLSYAAGLLLCATIELPMAAVIKRFQGSKNTINNDDFKKYDSGNVKIKNL
ncbi:O-acyltransferase like protein-like [Armigeres subalbatus]|uniref:O-acyltransferase like protein-like n=1 Tax=Armigeres subalbatus TaxID=124917 RepID=UPI002ED28728